MVGIEEEEDEPVGMVEELLGWDMMVRNDI